MSDAFFELHLFYEIGSVIALASLFMRDQIVLRLMVLAANALFIAHGVVAGAVGLEFVAWNGVNVAINLHVLADLAYGRTAFRLSAEDRALLARFGTLTPGEFRRLMRSGVRRRADAEVEMTAEGSRPEKLFFVTEGAITVLKAGRRMHLPAQAFVGEIAFLEHGVATATVRVTPRTRWVEWPAPALRRQLDRDRALRAGLTRLIGDDLARKLARA